MRLVSGLLNADQTNRTGSHGPLAWQGHEDALALKLNNFSAAFPFHAQLSLVMVKRLFGFQCTA